jgi:hypothetical protein
MHRVVIAKWEARVWQACARRRPREVYLKKKRKKESQRTQIKSKPNKVRLLPLAMLIVIKVKHFYLLLFIILYYNIYDDYDYYY